jgi:methoxymalonate biosynthesis acyl carrier protein
MNEIKETIRQFILSKYLPTERPENLRNDTPLQTSGLLDSLAAINLVNFVEQHFDVKLDIRDTGIERFDRIDDIAALIARKRAC